MQIWDLWDGGEEGGRRSRVQVRSFRPLLLLVFSFVSFGILTNKVFFSFLLAVPQSTNPEWSSVDERMGGGTCESFRGGSVNVSSSFSSTQCPLLLHISLLIYLSIVPTSALSFSSLAL